MIRKFHGYFPSLMTTALLIALSQDCIAGTLSQEELANATYSNIEESGPITLTDGHWEGKPFEEGGASFPQVEMAETFYLTGDLNGDNVDEAVVLLSQNSGGTGTFNYVIAADRKNDEVRILGIAEIGDRVQVRSGRIDGGLIMLDVVQHAVNEPACCPSELATRSWSLEGDRLQEGKALITGTLSLETLAGTEWILTHLKQNEALTQGAEVTLLFGNGQVSGKSACNRYTASIEQGGEHSELEVGPAMGTRMACPDDLINVEQQYLQALSEVTAFHFSAGKLILNWEKDDQWYAMFFTSR